MNTKPTRKYKVKDVEMVLAMDILLQNAIENKEFLQSKRSTWTDAFFSSFQQRVDDAAAKYLGADNAKELRVATQNIMAIVVPARNILAEVKTQILEDFKKDIPRRDQICNTLGYTAFKAANIRDDQEALLQLLMQFEQNLTTALKEELMLKGIAKDSLDTLISLGQSLKTADVLQEFKKGQLPVLTQAALNELNELYEDGMSIAKISAKLHKGQPAKQQQFTFGKIITNMNRKPKEAKAA